MAEVTNYRTPHKEYKPWFSFAMLAVAVSFDQLYPVFLWLCPLGGLL